MKEIYQSRRKKILVTTKSLINLLGVVYAHTKMSNEGDLYLTGHGLAYSDLLNIENLYEKIRKKSKQVWSGFTFNP